MSTLSKLALTLAVATSGVAAFDAVRGGVTGQATTFAGKSGVSLVLLLGSLLHAATYLALALLLRAQGDRIDANSRVRRVFRLGLLVSYALMAIYFGPVVLFAWATDANPDDLPAFLTVPAGLGFFGLFLFTIALGIALLRVADMRVPALVLTSVIGGIGLAALLGALGSHFAHPAYPETLAYIGTALTGYRFSRSRNRSDGAAVGLT